MKSQTQVQMYCHSYTGTVERNVVPLLDQDEAKRQERPLWKPLHPEKWVGSWRTLCPTQRFFLNVFSPTAPSSYWFPMIFYRYDMKMNYKKIHKACLSCVVHQSEQVCIICCQCALHYLTAKLFDKYNLSSLIVSFVLLSSVKDLVNTHTYLHLSYPTCFFSL